MLQARMEQLLKGVSTLISGTRCCFPRLPSGKTRQPCLSCAGAPFQSGCSRRHIFLSLRASFFIQTSLLALSVAQTIPAKSAYETSFSSLVFKELFVFKTFEWPMSKRFCSLSTNFCSLLCWVRVLRFLLFFRFCHSK